MRAASGVVLALLITGLSLPGCGLAVRKSAMVGVQLGDAGAAKGKIRPAVAEGATSGAAASGATDSVVHDSHAEGAEGGTSHVPGHLTVLFNTAEAHWHAFKTWFIRSYHRSTRWPRPYVTLSEAAFRDQWDVQANAGQKYVLGLFDFHFEAGSGNLNAAGRRRLLDLLRSMPPNTRTIYVQAARSAAETEQRVRAVRMAVEQSPLLHAPVEVAVLSDAPAPISGPEASKAARNLVESVGEFPRWMDRNTRINNDQQRQQN